MVSDRTKPTEQAPLGQLFLTFLKIGGLTFGGGLDMIPILERELVTKRQWLNAEEFADMLTLVNAAPGTFAINTAAYTGYYLRGFSGAVLAALGNVLIPFLLIIAISGFLLTGNVWMDRFLVSLRPAVIALVLAAGVRLGRRAYNRLFDWFLGIVTLVLELTLTIHPVFLILAGAGLGSLYEMLNKRHKKRKEALH